MQQPKFSSFPELVTERLSLRFPKASDAQAIFNLRTNTTINKYITRPEPLNLIEAKAFITKISNNILANENMYWVIVLNKTQEIIGSIGYHSFSNAINYAEIGYELHPDFHKKGYMSEAFQRAVQFGFHDLKLETIEAFTHKSNADSKALLLKNKFVHQPHKVDVGFENNSIFQLKLSDYIIT